MTESPSPFVTIMIPTRKRTAKLLRTLDQLGKTASSDDYEVIIMIDDDDQESLSVKQELESHPNTRVILGPRLGYAMLDRGYYKRMEEESKSPWVWIAGDDMLVEGDWLGQLRTVPKTGFLVQPEVSKLGGSTYEKAEAQAFPIFPRFCWKSFSDEFPKPFDTVGHEILRKNGWKTFFLNNVTMWHDRPPEHEIVEHRKM